MMLESTTKQMYISFEILDTCADGQADSLRCEIKDRASGFQDLEFDI